MHSPNPFAAVPGFLRGWMLVLLLAMLAMPMAGMAAPAPLMLDDAHPHVEAWPAVTVLHDRAGTLVADALLRRPELFA
ncbi:MAG TPA: hypothetical protein VF793_21650, partial [Telluria sp.]